MYITLLLNQQYRRSQCEAAVRGGDGTGGDGTGGGGTGLVVLVQVGGDQLGGARRDDQAGVPLVDAPVPRLAQLPAPSKDWL